MMAWIESHQQLREHPKTLRAADLLGVSVPAMIGHLQCLWWWALDYVQDGDLTDYPPSLIAKAMMWDGDPDKLIDALLTCGRKGRAGFLERTNDGLLLIHDWYDYAGKLIEKRKEDAERKRSKRQQSECPQDIQRTSNGRPTTVAGTVPTVPNLTVPTVPTEPTEPEGNGASRARKPRTPAKDPETAPKGDGNPQWGLFRAYCNALAINPKRVPDSQKKADLKYAMELVNAGYTPKDVFDATASLAQQPFYRDKKALRMVDVTQSIAQMKARASPVQPNGPAPPVDDYVPPTEEEVQARVAQVLEAHRERGERIVPGEFRRQN